MTLRSFSRWQQNPRDLFFVGILALCLLIAVAAIHSEMDKREVLLHPGGARKIDLATVRKQISDGELSSKKALFFKKVPERP